MTHLRYLLQCLITEEIYKDSILYIWNIENCKNRDEVIKPWALGYLLWELESWKVTFSLSIYLKHVLNIARHWAKFWEIHKHVHTMLSISVLQLTEQGETGTWSRAICLKTAYSQLRRRKKPLVGEIRGPSSSSGFGLMLSTFWLLASSAGVWESWLISSQVSCWACRCSAQ